MHPQLFASFGLVLIGTVATGLIYWFGTRRILEPNNRRDALRWTGAFALSICTFCGAAPFLTPQATWILLLPLVGIWLSLDSIQGISTRSSATLPLSGLDISQHE